MIKMDFKSLLSKLDSMEAPASTPAAPTLDKAVQLNEDAQLRVLAGQTTYVAEAKKKKDEEKKEEKVDEATKTDKPWTDMKGNKHSGTAVKGDKYQGKEAEAEEKKEKKAKKESIEPEFKSKFMKMVEAKKEEAADKKKAKKKMDEAKKPDDDGDGVPDWADKKPGEDDNEGKKKGAAPKKGVNPFAKKEVKEATKTDKPWTDMKGNKHPGTAVKGDKYTGKEAEKDAKKDKNESVSRSKRVVAESVGNVLSFRDMVKLVQESGGQQQIDAVDTTLFAWAQRVAASKYTESAKAEVFAGMLYERNGGRFEMYDVLSEDQE